MDQQRFDDLTRRLSAATNRRRVIAALAGVLAGAATASGGPVAANGRKGLCRPALVGCTRDSQCCGGACMVGKPLPRHLRNRCACDEGLEVCGGACVDLETNVLHCGECGNACEEGDTCVSGMCVPPWDCTTYDGSGFEDWIQIEHYCFDQFDGPPVPVRLSCGGDLWGAECTSASDCPEVLGSEAFCISGWAGCYSGDNSFCKGYTATGDETAGTCAYGRLTEICPPN